MPGYARHQADEQTQNCLMRYAYQAYVLLQYIEFACFCRPDKAFTPHPAFHNKHLSAI
ncbi:hypothetical protein ACLB1S_10140 [Escherichia coli]